MSELRLRSAKSAFPSLALAWLFMIGLGAVEGCRSQPSTGIGPRPAGVVTSEGGGLFEDFTERAGITFRHTNGSHDRYLFLQTLGGGCAVLDYDRDERPDLVFVSCGEFPPRPKQWNLALYHNEGKGSFRNVTAGSGLDVNCGYAHGVVAGDYDNDGRSDLFVTSYGSGNRLFRNETPEHSTEPRFREVTRAAGLVRPRPQREWASSAAFGDYDRDGRLDLYVGYYAIWSPELDKKCPLPNGPETCSPSVYAADCDRLYRNLGNGRFVDVTRESGLGSKQGRALALCWLDYDGDGWSDVYVANDMNPNFLWRNNGNGTFTEIGVSAGVAYGSNGAAQSGMGVAVGDYDNSGRESLLVTNLNGQLYSLFHNDNGKLFSYASETAGLRLPTFAFSGFGTAFLDYDRDGFLDLVTGNGHVNPDIDRFMPGVTYEEPNGLFHNERDGTFRDVSENSGALRQRRSRRGLAVLDFDNDGRMDIVCVNRNARVELFRNMSRDAHRWLSLRLVGTKSNRDGAGTKVLVTSGARRQFAEARLGSSYASGNDPRLHFGLGASRVVDTIELRWPSGTVDRMEQITTNQFLVCTEGKGYVRAR